MEAVAEREHPLLGAARLLVAAGAAEGRVEAVVVERLLQRHRLHDVRVALGAVVERVDVLLAPFGVDPDQQLGAGLGHHAAAEGDHLLELPDRVDVQQRERDRPGVEGLLGEAEHHRGVLADRVQHHRLLELGDDLAQDVDALGLELAQVGEAIAAHLQTAPPSARRLAAAQEAALLEAREQALDARADVERRRVQGQVRARRRLVGRRDAGELLDLAGAGAAVELLGVAPLADVERRVDEDLEEAVARRPRRAPRSRSAR